MHPTLPDHFQQKIEAIKAVIHLPLVVGFGISNQEMAACVLEQADGVVVGSLFVKTLEDGEYPSTLSKLARAICPQALISKA